MTAKRALSRMHAPDEQAAQERAWALVSAAYHERVVPTRRSPRWRLALAMAVLGLLGALALSPAGATVGRLITHALGVQHARTSLFSLPAPGRLLVSGPGGTWTIGSRGSPRRLGPWRQSSWSPRGRYIAVATGSALAVVDPHGVMQWRIARSQVSDPRWYPPLGYRVAYLSGDNLRVIAGDGTGDHLLQAGVARVAPAWRPNHPFQLAYVAGSGGLVVRDADTGQKLWSAVPRGSVKQLGWSGDGRRLLTLSGRELHVYSAMGKLLSIVALPAGVTAVDGALSPDGRLVALVLRGSDDEIMIKNLTVSHAAARRLLSGPGLQQVLWSPNGRWLLVSWPRANQWVFLRVAGGPRIAAVSRIAQQFSGRGTSRRVPRLEGWCCTAKGF